ncbi:MAG: CoA transferase [Hyphomicrobiaceae bacterium]
MQGTGEPDLEAWGGNPRYAIYPTADGGYLAVCLLEAKLWHQFCRVIGREDLIVEERQEDRHSRHGGRAVLYREAIAQYCLSRPRDVIASEMAKLAIPVMPVLSPDEAVAHENSAARKLAVKQPHSRQGAITELANPLAAAGLTREGGRSEAPGLGEHGAQVLAMLGYDSGAIARLQERGIV